MLLAPVFVFEPNEEDERFNGHPPLGVNATCLTVAFEEAFGKDRGFNGHPPLGVNATKGFADLQKFRVLAEFQRAPTLGGECYAAYLVRVAGWLTGFNGHPPLGVNATARSTRWRCICADVFQRAPTLGGECYIRKDAVRRAAELLLFQRAPTLGGECYTNSSSLSGAFRTTRSFNGHPPLGVNATRGRLSLFDTSRRRVSTGTHPWG